MSVEHERNHPNVHNPWAEYSESEVLHVASPYSNPFRWCTRRELANNFRRHMISSPNVKFYMGELAYGDRPFEVTDCNQDPRDVQMRTNHELWHKENILNQVIKRFPPDWKYGAIIDADIMFTRPDWALETIHQLQHYDWVQMFSSYADLNGGAYGVSQQPMFVREGFMFTYMNNGCSLPEDYKRGGWGTKAALPYYHGGEQAVKKGKGVRSTGLAWAFRRSAFDAVGGLLDKCILGSGDLLMALGLVAEDLPETVSCGYTQDYCNTILAWQKNAARLKRNIGYMDCFVVHYYHGAKKNRGYGSRNEILIKHKYEPSVAGSNPADLPNSPT